MKWINKTSKAMIRYELMAEDEMLAIVQKVDSTYLVKDLVSKKDFLIKPNIFEKGIKEILKKAECLIFNEWQYQEERYLYVNALVEAKMFNDMNR